MPSLASFPGVACQNGSVPEWLSRSSGPGNKRGVIIAFSAPLGTVRVHAVLVYSTVHTSPGSL